MKIKRIKYWDSTHSTNQLDKPIKPSEMEVIGFVIEETDDYITLAQEIIDGKEYFNQISIPKGAIIRGEPCNFCKDFIKKHSPGVMIPDHECSPQGGK